MIRHRTIAGTMLWASLLTTACGLWACGPRVRTAGNLGGENADLVAAYIVLREWPGSQLEVEPAEVVELAGVSFFEAWPHRDAGEAKGNEAHYRCVVSQDDVWCNSEQILAGIAGVLSLGTNTGLLDDEEWVRLCTWATGVDRMGTKDPVDWFDPRFSGRMTSQLAGKMTERHPGGGITVTVFYEFALQGGGRTLRRRASVSVMADNTVQVTHEDLWPFEDR